MFSDNVITANVDSEVLFSSTISLGLHLQSGDLELARIQPRRRRSQDYVENKGMGGG